MEPFVDFGLFEILAASGVTAAARVVFRRPAIARTVIVVGLAAPVALVFLASSESIRWLGALCLVTAALNAGALWPLTSRGALPASPPATTPTKG